MNKKTIAGILLAFSLVVALTAFGQQKYQARGPQWEYQMVYIPDSSSEEASMRKLNELGAQGWEMVFVQPRGADTASGLYHLKRQK